MTAPQTPTPGVPLSAEAVGYVRDYWDALCDCDWHLIPEDIRDGLEDRLIAAGLAEWRSVTDEDMEDSFASERGLEKGGSCLDLTPLGYLAYKADAEGWMTWSGGENPVPGQTVHVRFRKDGDQIKARYGASEEYAPCWKHEGVGEDIIAFRLTTPSDQGEEWACVIDPAIIATVAASTDNKIQVTTTPASGSDGLETKGWVRHLDSRTIWRGTEKPVHFEDDEGFELVTREAAEKRIGELEEGERNAWANWHGIIEPLSAYATAQDDYEPILAALSDGGGPDEVGQSYIDLFNARLKRALTAESQVAALKAALDPIVKELRDAGNGLFKLKTERGDYGLFDELADRIDQALALKEGR